MEHGDLVVINTISIIIIIILPSLLCGVDGKSQYYYYNFTNPGEKRLSGVVGVFTVVHCCSFPCIQKRT